MVAEQKFKTITVFEQRDQSGGIWNYTGDEDMRHQARRKLKWRWMEHLHLRYTTRWKQISSISLAGSGYMLVEEKLKGRMDCNVARHYI